MSAPLHPIEQIESLIKSSISHVRGAIELKMWPANAGVQVGGICSARQGDFVIMGVGESYIDT
ncbi:MAG: hypothetical protein GXP16_17700 [Gammaproteobacteria bacterium]|nr:hypothetical protein [Gammaproteobacteria bacterium]